MNPWTDSFEQYRQDLLGENKKKSDKQSKERWQDDDCDDKWYEKSDVDGKISDREKKEKKKHYAKEDIADIIARLEKKRISKGGDPDESPLPSMKKYHASKKKKKVKKGDWIGPPPKKETKSEEVVQEADSLSGQVARWEAARQKRMKQRQSYERPSWIPRDQDHEDNWGSSKGEKKKEKKESVEVNHIDGSTTQIIDVVRAPAMVAAPKFSNWKEEMSYEALKGEKLDIDAEKGKVKNQVDINPTIKTEEKKKLIEGDKVKYYGGEDRDKKTGYPKGLKSSRKEKSDDKKDDNKKVDYTTMSQSYEPEGEMIENIETGAKLKPGSGLGGGKIVNPAGTKKTTGVTLPVIKAHTEPDGELVDEGKFSDAVQNTLTKANTAVDKFSKTKFGGPITNALRTVFGPWKSTDGGENRTSATAASQKAKGLRTTLGNSYEPEGELVEGDYHSGQGEKKQKRTLKWMKDRAKPGEDVGAPGLDAYKAKQKEHEDNRGKKKVSEAKVDQGRSDYGKATIRNYRRFGPGHGEPAMFDPENKRGKAIDKRREEHKERQGKKKAKVPAYKVEHHKKPGEEHPIDESIFGPELTKYLGKDNIKKNVQVPPEQKDFVKSMPDPTVIRGGRTKVKGGPTVSNWRRGTNDAMRMLQQNSHEPQGEQIDEFLGGKPNDGYLGHPNLDIKNPLVPDSKRSKKPIGNTGNLGINVNKVGARLGDRNFKEEGEVLEATKYSKVKGKNYKSGKKSVKGGTAKGDLAYKTALANIIKQVGAGGVQQSSKQGKKKKGEKGRKQIGDRKFSPAETIRRRKASAKAAYKAMTDTRGT